MAGGENAVGMVWKVGGKLLGLLWKHRREVAIVVALWVAVVMITWKVLAAVAVIAAGVCTIPAGRRWLLGWPGRSRTRRQVTEGLTAVAKAVGTLDGSPLPKIRRIRTSPVGHEVILRATPGWTSELTTNLSPILRSSARCRSVRIDRDEADGGRISLDIVRRDAFASGRMIPWADLDRTDLTLWDDVHVGVGEDGRPVRLGLIYRGMIIGGVMDSGKSSMMTTVVAHGAMSPAHLVLIDPNRVQFGPWRHRALAYAESDPDEAIAVLLAVQAEIDRRFDLLGDMAGVVRKIDRELAAQHDGLDPILLVIDELAYHTATVGTPAQRQTFGNTARDVVSRGRAVGLIPVMGTQRPTQDVVPRALADLFPYQLAFRVRNPGNSDVILGERSAAQGYDASEISSDTPGVAWLRASVWQDGSRSRLAGKNSPRRIKGCWIGDDTVAELAGASLPYRPAPPPGWTLPAPSTRTTRVAA